jgi:hypothetical protein
MPLYINSVTLPHTPSCLYILLPSDLRHAEVLLRSLPMSCHSTLICVAVIKVRHDASMSPCVTVISPIECPVLFFVLLRLNFNSCL